MTPLHLAAEKGNLKAVQKLVENAFCPAELGTKNNVTFWLFARNLNCAQSSVASRNRSLQLVCFVFPRVVFKGFYLLSFRNLCVHKAREISQEMFSRESSRGLLWENKIHHYLRQSFEGCSILYSLMYFLLSLFISYAKSGETAFDIAQRKGYCDVVRYLSEKLTGKISIEGDCEVNVSGQG